MEDNKRVYNRINSVEDIKKYITDDMSQEEKAKSIATAYGFTIRTARRYMAKFGLSYTKLFSTNKYKNEIRLVNYGKQPIVFNTFNDLCVYINRVQRVPTSYKYKNVCLNYLGYHINGLENILYYATGVINSDINPEQAFVNLLENNQ